MGMKSKINLLAVIVLLFSCLPGAHALTLDVGINNLNYADWSVTDGTNSLTPLYNPGNPYFFAGPGYINRETMVDTTIYAMENFS